MNDMIYRQDAIDAVDKRIKQIGYEDNPYVLSIRQTIRDVPSAQPRMKGEWEYHSNPNIRGGMNPEDAYCSVCGFNVWTPETDFDNYNFCPNCGADMRGEENALN